MTIPSNHESLANVHRLQPLRVLLAGGDRRFIRVMSFLLARRGYNVAQSSQRDTVEAAERHRSDIVLLELGDSRISAGRKVAALQALSTMPTVFVVVDRGDDSGWNGVSAIRKWMPIEELVRELEAAALSRPAPIPGDELADGESARL